MIAILNVLLPALALLVAGAPDPPGELARCPAGEVRCVGLVVHVAGELPGPWFAQQVADANRLFAPAGLGFRVVAFRGLERAEAQIRSRKDRDLLGRARYARGVVHVFVVDRLDNVDEPGEIRGVHWRDRTDRRRRWVILSKIAPVMVLAHELGHFFGLPHSAYVQSLMNKAPRAEPPWEERTFVPREIARVRRRLAEMLASGELHDEGVRARGAPPAPADPPADPDPAPAPAPGSGADRHR